jgi:hypothetical protein
VAAKPWSATVPWVGCAAKTTAVSTPLTPSDTLPGVWNGVVRVAGLVVGGAGAMTVTVMVAAGLVPPGPLRV